VIVLQLILLLKIPAIKISDRFVIPKLTQHIPAIGTERRAIDPILRHHTDSPVHFVGAIISSENCGNKV
jgi:hypothetical protein